MKRLLILFTMAVFACGSSVADDQKPLKSGVVASQAGAELTLQDIDAQASNIPEKDRPGFFDSPKRIESTIMNLLEKKELAAEARAQHLDRDPMVKAEIELAVTAALAKAQVDHYRKSIKLPDFDPLAKEYYSAHRDEFVEKGQVTVEHVLVATKDTARSDAEAKGLITKVESEAKAHPDRFEDLVAKYSDDPSKTKNQGKITNATSPKMAKAFAQAAAELQTPGEISPIVKSEFGYHVLKLIEIKPGTITSFAEVHDRIVAQLKANFIDAQMTQYTNEFRGKPLQANPDLVASLRTRYLAEGAMLPEDAAEAAAAKAKKAQ